MAHYALVDNNNIVAKVIVCDQDPMNIDIPRKEAEDMLGRWLQTSYNTHGGIHYNSDNTPSGQPGFRGNYAGIGYQYVDELDAFIPPKPHESWTLDTTIFQWQAPVNFDTSTMRGTANFGGTDEFRLAEIEAAVQRVLTAISGGTI
jgi:hypothetical protein